MSKYTLRNFMLGSLFVVSSSLSAAEYLNINEYFHVNKTELDTQKDPKVSMDKDSGFAVVWINHHKDESGSTKDDIYVRFFDKNAKSISNKLKVNECKRIILSRHLFIGIRINNLEFYMNISLSI